MTTTPTTRPATLDAATMTELVDLVDRAHDAAKHAGVLWAQAILDGADKDTLAAMRAKQDNAHKHAQTARTLALSFGDDPARTDREELLLLLRVHVQEAEAAAGLERPAKRTAPAPDPAPEPAPVPEPAPRTRFSFVLGAAVALVAFIVSGFTASVHPGAAVILAGVGVMLLLIVAADYLKDHHP